ncbi:hypothetical protein DN748_18820 [Sinomicrobium soli]|nr:hypothetical protein DN748_18820 [Sinomicrobium sp. N-1-3-6]
MNLRKIIVPLFIALPIPIFLKIRWLPNVYDALFKGIYRYYDFEIETLREFIFHVYGSSYFIDYVLSVLMLMLPFQLIKDYYSKKNIRLSFLKKWGILTCIVSGWIILLGTFSNIWWVPWYKNMIYIAYALFLGLICTTLLYFAIDRHVDKNNQPTKNK